ncbi:MAG: mechanosensitive ion channel family protein [Gammaproteobacteria bacterium]|nr:mechanosensitive ion channel family protein [Gammaproteobacteria bacterium]
MQEGIDGIMNGLDVHPELQTLLAIAALALAAWVAHRLARRLLIRLLERAMRRFGSDRPDAAGVARRLVNIVPALILSLGIGAVPGLPEVAVTVVRNVCAGVIVVVVALAASAALDLANLLYQRRPDAHRHPIKGYLQVIKIVLYAVAAILVIATLIDRSPLILLSGLGAMAAVLMLIFQDTLLSLVASVQITSNDIVRVGDWVEMPQLTADGDVIDIALHTVKVKNWDKTVTSVPTRRFITDPFKNWRGMQESGGRRIKRSLYLDQQSVHFLGEAERDRLRRFDLLREYLEGKEREITDWNARLAGRGQEPVNARRLTNLGSFRAYIEHYLRRHPGIHRDMSLMVRQLNPTADGLPLEIYCFTRTTAWVEYENIQSDIFDHLLAILPEFGLRVFQHPSGADLRSWRDAPALKAHGAGRS